MKTATAFLLPLFTLFGCANVLRGDGFLYSKGVFTPVSVLGVAPGFVTPTGINNAGQIVGGVYAVPFGQRGFVGNGRAFTLLSAPDGNYGTTAFAINDAGQIVGSFSQGPGGYSQAHGFLYANGTYTTIDFQSLAPGQEGGTALTGINNHGQIVGYFNTVLNFTAINDGFLYSDGNFTTIVSPALFVLGVNDAGEIVANDPNSSGGFLYYNGVYTAINVPGSTGTVPTAISNLGQIVGWYWDTSGKMHGFLDTNGIFTTIDPPYAAGLSAPAGNTQLWGINDAGDIVGTGPSALQFIPVPPCRVADTRIRTARLVDRCCRPTASGTSRFRAADAQVVLPALLRIP